MAAIDWSNLYRATNKDNTPTPGYLFNDIVQNVANAKPSELPGVAEYLAECVDGDHAHVKLKALFVIKTLAYRIPPFQQCMLERLATVQEAASFTGPPSEMFGDEPYRLIREAAEGALEALNGGEFYHQEYRQLSQRIIGFGNYQPPEDSVLPDGSVNVARNVTFGDVVGSAVGGVLSGAGAVFGGFRELFAGHSQNVPGLELDGMGACADDAAPDDAEMPPYDDPPEIEEEDGYAPSTGTYVPPTLPMPSSEPVHLDEEGEQQQQEACFAAAISLLDTEEQGPSPVAPSPHPEELDEGAMLRVLGMPGSLEQMTKPQPAAGQEEEGQSEEILGVLGLRQR
eukprot:TRINITY_DN80735_c0_g1_i1.p1 TRINITY_DN80735_c0_g1~~TRINITY_DN80735_c0_g1_i1.p1  ORF type:complete len:341 (-),score=80.95 TRINITY_DN80735_c0_g1_i1:38-1060(-)